MGTLGDQLRAIGQRAIAAGMRLLSEDEIGEHPPQVLWCPQEAGTGCRLPAVPRQSASAIPRNLRRLREAKGWNIPSLAAESGVSTSTIRGLEQGRGTCAVPDPQSTTLLKLAHALNVGIEELVREV